jgi:ribosomal protein S18 acetylase RimI-like enzyme
MLDSQNIQFRPAEKSDCRTIATLYSISSDGVADYIWSKLAQPGEDLLAVGQRRYERENSQFSYQNCTFAILDGNIVGMLVAFPMLVDETATPEDDPVLVPYSKLEEENSYYVCGVAVFPEYRNRGIGSQLMALAETNARAKDSNKLSLIVFEQNQAAKHLYDRLGYREIRREPIVAHPLIHYSGHALLMVKQLSSRIEN